MYLPVCCAGLWGEEGGGSEEMTGGTCAWHCGSFFSFCCGRQGGGAASGNPDPARFRRSQLVTLHFTTTQA